MAWQVPNVVPRELTQKRNAEARAAAKGVRSGGRALRARITEAVPSGQGHAADAAAAAGGGVGEGGGGRGGGDADGGSAGHSTGVDEALPPADGSLSFLGVCQVADHCGLEPVGWVCTHGYREESLLCAEEVFRTAQLQWVLENMRQGRVGGDPEEAQFEDVSPFICVTISPSEAEGDPDDIHRRITAFQVSRQAVKILMKEKMYKKCAADRKTIELTDSIRFKTSMQTDLDCELVHYPLPVVSMSVAENQFKSFTFPPLDRFGGVARSHMGVHLALLAGSSLPLYEMWSDFQALLFIARELSIVRCCTLPPLCSCPLR